MICSLGMGYGHIDAWRNTGKMSGETLNSPEVYDNWVMGQV